MRVLKYILFLVLGIVLVALLAAFFVPKNITLVKQISIERNADSVFDFVHFLKNQEEYSVWYQSAPNMQRKYQGTDGTEGFILIWKGAELGAGTQTITSIIDHSRMESRMVLKKPFKSKADLYMLVEANGINACTVSWGFTSHTPYPLNILVPIFGIKKKVSEDFELGLHNLKSIMEKR